jgi:predicted nucleotidyltransferase
MRLTAKQHQAIKEAFHTIFHTGEVYLFGSRVDDTEKGGDIDLYLHVRDQTDLAKKRIAFLVYLKRLIGEQKIDVVFQKDSTRLIEQEALKTGVLL